MGRVAALVAMAVVVYAVANVAHEGSHGLACVAVGGRPVALEAVYFDCDKSMLAGGEHRLVPALGTAANVLLAAVAWRVLRRLPRRAGQGRYAWWLFFTVNGLQAAGYGLFSGVAKVGDWAKVIDGLEPRWAWRLGLTVVGALAYLAVIRVSVRELAVFVGSEHRVARARALTVVPYVTGGVLYVGAGLLNPIGLYLVAISAAAASLGGTSALAWMFSLVRHRAWAEVAEGPHLEPKPTVGWLVAAGVLGGAFIAVLGPSIRF